MANSIQHNQYWLRLVVCASEHIMPALLDALHNDGPNADPNFMGIPRDPKLLHIFLSTSGSRAIIQSLRQRRIITPEHYNLLFPPGCVETDSQKFDPFLKKIMIRNFTTLRTNNGNWHIHQILPGDTSLAANTVRAVAFINSVYRYGNQADMEKIEFDNKFAEADNILKGMRYTGNISNVKTMSLDPERISVLKALYNQMLIQTNQLAKDKSAADNAIMYLKEHVSQMRDEILLLKENNHSATSFSDELMVQVRKVMIDTESIKDEMSRNERKERVDQLKNVEKQQEEKSKCQQVLMLYLICVIKAV